MNNDPATSENDNSSAVDNPSISFISRIAMVMECLSQGYTTVSDIAEYCDFTSSTTHRLLNTLKTPGLTICDQVNHRYYLGPTLCRLITNTKTTHQYLSLDALKEMKRLSEIADENVSLDMMIGFQSMNLNMVLCKHGLQVLEDDLVVTPVIPLGSTWKVLLSQLERSELKKALEIARDLVPVERRVDDISEWMEEMKAINKAGYFVSHGEKLAETIAISVPVRNYVYPVVLTIVGPESRILHRVDELVRELRESSHRLSDQIKDLYQN